MEGATKQEWQTGKEKEIQKGHLARVAKRRLEKKLQRKEEKNRKTDIKKNSARGRGGGRAQAKQAWEVHGGKQESETDKRQEKAQRKIWRET